MTRKPTSARPQVEALDGRLLPSFGNPTAYALPTAPEAVVAADVNGDQTLDLVTAGNGVTVQLGLAKGGKPTGTFGPARAFATAPASALAVGDVNRDGKPDVVTDTGGVLLGNGDGTFRAGPNSAVSSSGPVLLADVNSDGKPDVLTGGSVFLGNGDGTFQAALPVSGTPAGTLRGMAVADLTGDGRPDLVLGTTAGASFGTVTVSLQAGNGDGTFGPAVTLASESESQLYGLAVADFNADGKLDVAYDSYYFGLGSADRYVRATVLLGDGGGGFRDGGGANLTWVDPSTAIGLAAGDVNHDGKPDLIAVSGINTDGTAIDVLFGRGDGSFGSEYDFLYTGTGTGFAVADFNGDGYADVAVVGSTSTGFAVDVLPWVPTKPKK